MVSLRSCPTLTQFPHSLTLLQRRPRTSPSCYAVWALRVHTAATACVWPVFTPFHLWGSTLRSVARSWPALRGVSLEDSCHQALFPDSQGWMWPHPSQSPLTLSCTRTLCKPDSFDFSGIRHSVFKAAPLVVSRDELERRDTNERRVLWILPELSQILCLQTRMMLKQKRLLEGWSGKKG